MFLTQTTTKHTNSLHMLQAKFANITYVPLFSDDLYDQWDSVSFRHHKISASRVFAGVRPRCSPLCRMLPSMALGVGAGSGWICLGMDDWISAVMGGCDEVDFLSVFSRATCFFPVAWHRNARSPILERNMTVLHMVHLALRSSIFDSQSLKSSFSSQTS